MVGVEERIEKIVKEDKKKISKALKGEKFKQFYLGKITEDEYWKKVIDENDWDIDVNSLKKIIRNHFEEIEGVKDIVLKLKEKYPICLLSMHMREWIEYCEEKFKLSKLFPHIIYSYEVGMDKLNPEFFKIVLNKFKVKPEECLYIDDWPDYLNTAKQMGMNTILFKDNEQLKRDLRKHGIVV